MRDLRRLPKAHLHLHLEGSMRPATLAELAEERGVEMPTLDAWSTFADFLAIYDAACRVLRGPDDLCRLVAEVVEDAAADGAVWVELHANPTLHRERLGAEEAVLEVVLDAARAARRATGVGVGVVLAADRTDDVGTAVRLARLAAQHAAHGVVAFGLASDEVGHPPEPFADAFAIAGDAGLLRVPHAGELEGAASVRGALDALHPDRIAHGVRAVEDHDLVRRLAGEQVCLDVCLTSNLSLGVVPSMVEHPLPVLLDAGVPVTLNADDSLMFGSGLLDEYEVARATWGFDDPTMAHIARTSIERSGAPPEVRAAAAAAVDAWLES